LTIGTPTQYLLKHARWQILDHIRWNKRRSHETLDDLVVETPEIAENSFGTAVNRAPAAVDVETRMLIDDLESRLNAKQKEILHGLLDGFTWRQIGDSLGCTSANVAYHVRGIRQAYSELAGVPEGISVGGGKTTTLVA
jgi:RNA polymerase sigma-70 factor (ECF subfamily)